VRHALFGQTRAAGVVECRLCAHYCRLKPGQSGVCQVRHNVAGELLTSSYGYPVLLGSEPIEKKYLFHVAPGIPTLSLGTAGCNLGCAYCINWRVSQRGGASADAEVSAASIVQEALQRGAECIAFTYTEPTIFFEYAQEIARLARQAGLLVVAKSNGYMAPAVLREMASWLDALNIDLKGWRNAPHLRIVRGGLKPVLENLRLARRLGLWLEISTLIVPGLSDDGADLTSMAHFIATELGPDTPWHLLRFYPHYQLRDQPVTSQAQLEAAVECGRKAGLQHIYTKDVARGERLNTICPACQTIVIERKGYSLLRNNLRNGQCQQCGHTIRGVGLAGRRAREQADTTLEVA
jgi:pyruvate formate lyase activating enzyme